jgi:hypothetical protein
VSKVNNSSFILFNDLLDIPFIFQAEMIEHKWTDLEGISRGFLPDVPTMCLLATRGKKAIPTESGFLYCI